MSRYEKGNWPAQNTKNIITSIRRIFEKRSIAHLTEAAYKHITLHMHFIAHFNRSGFMDHYADLAKFAETLLTSEYSTDSQHNQKDADQYIRDNWFIKEYGKAYCQSVADSNKGIVELAIKFLPILQKERADAKEAAERAELSRLQAKYPDQK